MAAVKPRAEIDTSHRQARNAPGPAVECRVCVAVHRATSSGRPAEGTRRDGCVLGGLMHSTRRDAAVSHRSCVWHGA